MQTSGLCPQPVQNGKMPNEWFRFKQFIIRQDRCAMKVSTDACIQGAWAAKLMGSRKINNVLDIGTGTGLLSLMLAQSLSASEITGVELNEDACLQAKENFAHSAWSDRLSVHHSSIQEYHVHAKEKYDLVICNPPFFHRQLESYAEERRTARHSHTMQKEELAATTATLLNENGTFCVMYPETEWEHWNETASNHGLFLYDLLGIKPDAFKAKPNRIIGIYGKRIMGAPTTRELVIYAAPGVYTGEFKTLLQPYYLTL